MPRQPYSATDSRHDPHPASSDIVKKRLKMSTGHVLSPGEPRQGPSA